MLTVASAGALASCVQAINPGISLAIKNHAGPILRIYHRVHKGKLATYDLLMALVLNWVEETDLQGGNKPVKPITKVASFQIPDLNHIGRPAPAAHKHFVHLLGFAVDTDYGEVSKMKPGKAAPYNIAQTVYDALHNVKGLGHTLDSGRGGAKRRKQNIVQASEWTWVVDYAP